jgi:hypothetical protein
MPTQKKIHRFKIKMIVVTSKSKIDLNLAPVREEQQLFELMK